MRALCTVALGLAASAFIYAGNSNAADSYISSQIEYTELDIDGEVFNPYLVLIKAGTAASSGLFEGVGLEVVVGTPSHEVQEDEFSVKIGQHWAGYLTFTRLQFPKVAIYVGYASTKVSSKYDISGNNADATLEGASYGISLQDRMGKVPNTYWMLDCTEFYTDGDVSLRGCGLGIKYGF